MLNIYIYIYFFYSIEFLYFKILRYTVYTYGIPLKPSLLSLTSLKNQLVLSLPYPGLLEAKQPISSSYVSYSFKA